MNDKKYNYSLRFVLVPGIDEDKRIADLVEFCKNSLIDDVIFFIAPEDFYRGHITKQMAQPFVDQIIKAKKALSEIGVTTSLNPWCTLVHGDRGRKLFEGQNFNLMQAADGMVGTTVVCPLSKEWQTYYVDYLKYLIEQIHPETIWLEDDFRLHGHFAGCAEDVSCFCPEHMALYAEQLGVDSLSREDFVKGLRENKSGYREAYSCVCQKTMEGVLQLIVSKVGNLGTRLALMTSGGISYHFEGRNPRNNFEILSRYKPTINRLGLASYRQTSSHKQAYLFNRFLAPSRAFFNDDTVTYSEIENAPMSRYCKSAGWTAFQMITTCPLLLDGATFDIFEFNGNGVKDGEFFTKTLKRVKPFLEKLLQLGLKPSDSSGVEIAILKNRYLGMPTVNCLETINTDDNFIGSVISLLGGAVKYTENASEGDIVALLPTTASILSDSEIKEILSKRLVILPADTVQILLERGYGNILNVTASEKLLERRGNYTYEQITKKDVVDDEYLRASCQLFVGHYLKLDYKNGCYEPYTSVYNYDFSFVGNGITLVNGNILIFPYFDSKECWKSQEMPFGLLHELRGMAINHAIHNADQSNNTLSTQNCMVIPYYFKGKSKDYVILVNYLEDQVDSLSVCCNQNYSSIKAFSVENPSLTNLTFKKYNNKYVFNYVLQGNSAVILEMCK